MRPLDRIDLKILDVLQRDGRISMTDLAERVSLSATPCSERVRRLEREGVITGYYARVNPAALGKNLLVFLEIKFSTRFDSPACLDLYDNKYEIVNVTNFMQRDSTDLPRPEEKQ